MWKEYSILTNNFNLLILITLNTDTVGFPFDHHVYIFFIFFSLFLELLGAVLCSWWGEDDEPQHLTRLRVGYGSYSFWLWVVLKSKMCAILLQQTAVETMAIPALLAILGLLLGIPKERWHVVLAGYGSSTLAIDHWLLPHSAWAVHLQWSWIKVRQFTNKNKSVE